MRFVRLYINNGRKGAKTLRFLHLFLFNEKLFKTEKTQKSILNFKSSNRIF